MRSTAIRTVLLTAAEIGVLGIALARSAPAHEEANPGGVREQSVRSLAPQPVRV